MADDLRVAIYGAGGGGELILHCLDGTGCRATVFFDADSGKQGGKLRGVPVDAPENVLRHGFDYLVIASTTIYEEAICTALLKRGVPARKIIPRTLMLNNMAYRVRAYRRTGGVRACVSGMSYHRQAVVPDFSEHAVFNCASTSQDLYYGAAMARALLKSGTPRPETWLVGLTYYSLHYDMSLSKTWPCVFYYKDLFGYHHLSGERRGYYLGRFDAAAIADSLPEAVFDNLAEAEHRSQVLENTGTYDFGASDAVSEQARADANKWYPQTVAENKGVLEAFVRMLAEGGVTPVLTFVPFPASYPIRAELEDECFGFVAELEARYGCKTLNGYALDGFTNRDFYDSSHLNVHGGRKFTDRVDALLRSLD